MKKLAIVMVMALVSCSAFADWDPVAEYRNDCVLKTGPYLTDKQCADLKPEAEREEQARERQAEYSTQFRIKQEKARADEAQRRAEEDEAAKKHMEEEARNNREHMQNMERQEREEQAALKRKCGKDYLAIRLGMTLARLQECHGAVYETETVTNKGTIETWRTIHDWVFVQNGVVTGITPRTD